MCWTKTPSVSLSHQQISAQPRGIDSWLSLAPVHPDQEVQGEIHLEVRMPEQGHPRVLRCHLIAARDLAPRDPSGTSDPFVRVSCCGHTRETAVIKKTRFPRWDEVLEFELAEDEPGDSVLSVEVWDWDIVGKNDFLGQVKVPLDASGPTEGWFQLLPFPSSTEEPGGQLGALRLTVRLLEDRVLPQHCYQPLIQLLAEPLHCPGQPAASTALAVLEEVTSGDSRQDVATKLVKVFLAQGLAVPFLDYVITRELARTTDPNTLFRSNSLASKSMEQFLKAVGLPYLHAVLKPVVNRIFEEKKYVELDPCKMELSRGRRISFKGSLSEAQVRESSLELLQGYLGDTVDAIMASVDKCPLLMRMAFKQLRRRVEERFPSPQHEEMRYFAISGFLFLRFFAPAILTPKLFGLREQHAEPRTGRTLLLLAKALQSIGNLGLQPGKEPWMAPLQTVLLPSVTRVRAFLDSLIEVESTQATAGEGTMSVAPFCPSATIKEGFLHMREAEEPSLLPRFAFKKRYFWLSTQALSYSKSPECQERGCIQVGHIRAVERVDEGTFPQPHVMQVVAQDDTGQLRTTYIQCKSAPELWHWLWALRQASSANGAMLPTCHPGTFRGARWTCCLQPNRAAPGCSRTHSAVALDEWSDPLDPAAAAQSLYVHLQHAGTRLRRSRPGAAAGGAAGPGRGPRSLRPWRRRLEPSHGNGDGDGDGCGHVKGTTAPSMPCAARAQPAPRRAAVHAGSCSPRRAPLPTARRGGAARRGQPTDTRVHTHTQTCPRLCVCVLRAGCAWRGAARFAWDARECGQRCHHAGPPTGDRGTDPAAAPPSALP
ncbi:rasGAP-activating-like protein 1 isoform X2 [Numida meleagris]|uniref:rasGAP-activating-like protein 1 isoform X2 n=1 Tax=Numida meleagris TaxID=8996 RepID=UPI000B3E069A|nr:rasGAP-activating-like protein 1 isoform X2 [Numida meleagris]XP_021268600.1 rasGAP-activating-like protein 1 isoform X2 [Numida meleagris]